MAKVKKFHLAAKAVIINRNKILLVESPKSHENRFGLPGGQIDEGEEILNTLKREVKEELGIRKITVGELIGIVQKNDEINKDFGLMFIVFRVKANVSKIKISKEHIGFRWIDKKEFNMLKKDKKNFHPGIIKIINKII